MLLWLLFCISVLGLRTKLGNLGKYPYFHPCELAEGRVVQIVLELCQTQLCLFTWGAFSGFLKARTYTANLLVWWASLDFLSVRGQSISALLKLECVNCDTVFCATIIAAVLSCLNESQNSRQQISSLRNVQVSCVTRDCPGVILVIPQPQYLHLHRRLLV